jgi:undecaprenyl-diphosphatase
MADRGGSTTPTTGDPEDDVAPASMLEGRERLLAGGAALLAAITAAFAVVARDAAHDAGSGLSLAAAVVLGIVEGITEYLPVSSTGHLLVSERILGLGSDANHDALDTYAICIQAGAIAAVLVLYRARLTQMVEGVRGRDVGGRRVLLAVVCAFVPTVAIALVLEDVVREHLFGPGPIGFAWLVGGGFVIWMARSRWGRGGDMALTELTVRHAAIIGVAQCVALWPGVSRSLVTIAAGLAIGLTVGAAVEFSFLLGLATLSAATAYEGLKNGSELIDTFGVGAPLLGLVVAFVAAVVAVRWMVAYLEHRGLAIFGWYRIAIGIVTLVAVATDRL